MTGDYPTTPAFGPESRCVRRLRDRQCGKDFEGCRISAVTPIARERILVDMDEHTIFELQCAIAPAQMARTAHTRARAEQRYVDIDPPRQHIANGKRLRAAELAVAYAARLGRGQGA